MSINALWTFLEQYSFVFGAFFIFIGLFLNFLGNKLIKPTIFIIGLGATVVGVLFIFYALFLYNTTATWVGWVVLACSILLGILVGWLLTKVVRVGVALLAGWGGVVLALVIYNAFLYKANSTPLFWCFIIGMGLVFSIVSFFIFEHACIIATSFIGAYMFVRGISMYAGGYPNEFTLIDMIRAGIIPDLDPIFYAYMAGILVMFVLGAIV